MQAILYVLGVLFIVTLVLILSAFFGQKKPIECLPEYFEGEKIDYNSLFDVKECFISWVKSCKTREQIQQLEKSLIPFVVNRFKGKVSEHDLSEATDEITDTIISHKIHVGKYFFLNTWIDKRNIPTLAYSFKNHNG